MFLTVAKFDGGCKNPPPPLCDLGMQEPDSWIHGKVTPVIFFF